MAARVGTGGPSPVDFEASVAAPVGFRPTRVGMASAGAMEPPWDEPMRVKAGAFGDLVGVERLGCLAPCRMPSAGGLGTAGCGFWDMDTIAGSTN